MYEIMCLGSEPKANTWMRKTLSLDAATYATAWLIAFLHHETVSKEIGKYRRKIPPLQY